MIFDRDLPENKLNGIYMILNTITGDFYIGQAGSKDGFNGRWQGHVHNFRHPERKGCNHLRFAYLKYGPAAFFPFVIEVVPKNKALLQEREQFWVDELKPAYNIKTKCVASSLGVKMSRESSQLKSAILSGQKRSEETRAKMRKPKSLAARANMSLVRLGKKATEANKARMRAGWARWREARGRD